MKPTRKLSRGSFFAAVTGSGRGGAGAHNDADLGGGGADPDAGGPAEKKPAAPKGSDADG
jgi:hypothetical protein